MDKRVLKEWNKIKNYKIFKNIDEFVKLFNDKPNGSCFKKYTNYDWCKENFFFGTYNDLLEFYKTSTEVPFYLNNAIGNKFGQLTIKSFNVKFRNNKRVYYANCCCDCGRECEKEYSKIVEGHVTTCGNHKLKHYNDLLSNYADVVNQYWDYSKNYELPQNINIHSSEKFWWKDSTGSFLMSPIELIRKHSGTSFNEQSILYYCKKIFNDVKSRYKIKKDDKNYEIDIFLHDIMLGIEYDGVFWHQNKIEQDKSKSDSLNDIHILRIREQGLPIIKTDNTDSIVFNLNDDFSDVLKSVFVYIKKYVETFKCSITKKELDNLCNFVINNEIFENDKQNILNQYRIQYVSDNITKTCLIKLWDYNKNSIIPQKVSPNDNIQVWFTCPYGFSRKINVKSICDKHLVFCSENKDCINCKSFYCPLVTYCNRWYGGSNNHCKQVLKYYYYRSVFPNKEHDKIDDCYYCVEDVYKQYINKTVENNNDAFYEAYSIYKYYLDDLRQKKDIPNMRYFKRCELSMYYFNSFDELLEFIDLWEPNIYKINYQSFDTNEYRSTFLYFLKDYMLKNKYKIKIFKIEDGQVLSKEFVLGLIKIIKGIFSYRKNPDYLFLYDNYSKFLN